jgi:hypothetical protein
MDTLPRDEWIEEFARLMGEAATPSDPSANRSLAEENWLTASHRSPANAVQDVLIERYLEAGQAPRCGVDHGSSAA